MVAPKKAGPGIEINIMDYNLGKLLEKNVRKVEDCFSFSDSSTVTWINIDGITKGVDLDKIGKFFNLHPLVMEDILTGQRPKMENYDEYIFIVLKMLHYNERKRDIESEQVSMVVGKDFVISFQEDKMGDVFDSVRARIRNANSRIRKMKSDYLAYALIDAIVDNYFVILEKVGENIETIEDTLVKEPTPENLQLIHDLKNEMINLRKSVWPLRELISGLQRLESSRIKASTKIYLRDLYDHTVQIIDTMETYRDMLSGMHDTYLSSISNRMNEIMKILTIFTTIFIPLTFVAGIYGMNFHYMPELDWEMGYPVVWVVMVLIAGTMLLFFKRKKWI